MMLVGLYILMGMGLNLEVGLAGLLDLGFVAFFAVGAYATAILTADSPHALASYTAMPSLSFWAAMPIAVIASVVVGVLFGIPVLGVRGDYLEVATMGPARSCVSSCNPTWPRRSRRRSGITDQAEDRRL
jgi:branched-chain amino acid transport system permease protein